MTSLPFSITKDWTLFLDRDGVINQRLVGDYVKSVEEFNWLPGVLEALNIFNHKFGCIVVVTNQQGIGKEIMTEDDLTRIHDFMLEGCRKQGGRIDAVYHCPMLAHEPHNCRKPHTAMADWAKRDFPQIQFNRSIMVGDSCSDIHFAKNAGMHSVQILEHQSEKCDADITLSSLLEMAHLL
jgi:histidinol-phosphate phosphatase family protein